VSDPNATLVVSFIGLITQEIPLKGRGEVAITMKYDCNKCFFDSQELTIYSSSGVLYTPVGGELMVSSPFILRGVIKASYNYQTDLRDNKFHDAKVELAHYISNCDFDIDFRSRYRKISFDYDMYASANAFEADINVRNLTVTVGYSHLNVDRMETTDKSFSGAVIGLGRYFHFIPLHPTGTAKVSFYNGKAEYSAELYGGRKWFRCSLKYYKLSTFNEVRLGIGASIGYRVRRPN
jgi:hypothetical protein